MRHIASLTLGATVFVVTACADAPTRPSTRVAREAVPRGTLSSAAPLSFRQVSTGGSHTCGVTIDNVAYCWGDHSLGQLGIGSRTGPERCSTLPCSRRPVRVAGGLAFREVAAGLAHTCGVTTDNVAYCWGINSDGQLGVGTRTGPEHCAFNGEACSTRPVRVVGGRAFRLVTASAHSCGVTTQNVAYCWGLNLAGGLGDGTTTRRLRPVRVAGGLTFGSLSAGELNTCGVAVGDVAYCWGLNDDGQLGVGNSTGPEICQLSFGNFPCSTRPVRVVGRLAFRQVNVGASHACGVTTGDAAYCWGDGRAGQLGVGSFVEMRTRPVPVTGGLAFERVNAGEAHTCGFTTDHVAYCWGSNVFGELGDGTSVEARARPVRVVGGLAFRAVATNVFHTCGITTGARAYCWGSNFAGEVGDGTFNNIRRRPVAVVAPRP